MNANLIAILLLSTGGILVYSAAKNKDPRDVIKNALGAKATPARPSGSMPTPQSTQEQYADPKDPI